MVLTKSFLLNYGFIVYATTYPFLWLYANSSLLLLQRLLLGLFVVAFIVFRFSSKACVKSFAYSRTSLAYSASIILVFLSYIVHFEGLLPQVFLHMTVSLIYISLLDDIDALRKITTLFRMYFIAISILLLISFFLYTAGFATPQTGFMLRPGHQGQYLTRIAFSLSHAGINAYGTGFWRLNGPFDEAGTLGLFLTFIYVISLQANPSARLERTLFLIAGLASFSLGFFISLPFLLFLEFKPYSFRIVNILVLSKKRLWIGIIILITGILGLMLVIYFLPASSRDIINNVFQDQIVDRFDLDYLSDGGNRQSSISCSYPFFIANPLFGVGREYLALRCDTASLIAYLASYGILGLVFFIAPLLILFRFSKSFGIKDLVESSTIFLLIILNMLQRPPTLSFSYVVLMYIVLRCRHINLLKAAR